VSSRCPSPALRPGSWFSVGGGANSSAWQATPAIMHHPATLALLLTLLGTLRSALRTRAELARLAPGDHRAQGGLLTWEPWAGSQTFPRRFASSKARRSPRESP